MSAPEPGCRCGLYVGVCPKHDDRYRGEAIAALSEERAGACSCGKPLNYSLDFVIQPKCYDCTEAQRTGDTRVRCTYSGWRSRTRCTFEHGHEGAHSFQLPPPDRRPSDVLPSVAEGEEAVQRLGIDVSSWAADIRARVEQRPNEAPPLDRERLIETIKIRLAEVRADRKNGFSTSATDELERLLAVVGGIEPPQSPNEAKQGPCAAKDVAERIWTATIGKGRPPPQLPNEARKGGPEHVAFWDAINEYVVTCGGDPSRHVYGNTPRMSAVAKVEEAARHWPAQRTEPALPECFDCDSKNQPLRCIDCARVACALETEARRESPNLRREAHRMLSGLGVFSPERHAKLTKMLEALPVRGDAPEED